ncbi:MAG: PH domain-containing protein [Candidatus Heimdallarchaeota archaeon]|nr:MAG: PH domain-containing protein [Candidatus Heimdallarchaeota archaeon]
MKSQEINSYLKGEPFYPISAFRNKLFLYIVSAFVGITTGIVLFGGFIGFFANLDNDPESDAFGRWITTHLPELAAWYLLLSLVIMLLAAILVVAYVRRIEYIVDDTEIVVKKGIINRTIKHVPFRTITNVSSRYGIYDRLFGIGTCEIQTAGKSGTQTGPEEKIEGIKNFCEVRDVVLSEIRKFRGQYATTTELEPSPPPTPADGFYKEMLVELREIKRLLAD